MSFVIQLSNCIPQCIHTRVQVFSKFSTTKKVLFVVSGVFAIATIASFVGYAKATHAHAALVEAEKNYFRLGNTKYFTGLSTAASKVFFANSTAKKAVLAKEINQTALSGIACGVISISSYRAANWSK